MFIPRDAPTNHRVTRRSRHARKPRLKCGFKQLTTDGRQRDTRGSGTNESTILSVHGLRGRMRPAGRLEESPTQEILKLTTLLQVSQSLSGTLDLKAALHEVLTTLAKHHNAVRTIVILLNKETQELH